MSGELQAWTEITAMSVRLLELLTQRDGKSIKKGYA